MGKKNRLIVLSDLHIGSDYKTNWYQKSVHENILLSILGYARENSPSISEMIIAGDLFDQWTYPADIEPPSFEEIVKANPGIFGDIISGGSTMGALAETLTALEGRITYINGNHDMSITPDDIRRLNQGRYSINSVNGYLYEPEAGRNKIVCTHGHIFSLFNAPDFINPPEEWGGLPLGYFMARLASHWTAGELMKKYPPGSTTADMPGGGTPSGPGFEKDAIHGCIKEAMSGNDHLSELVMGAQLEAAGLSKKEYILMPGRKKIKSSKIAGIYKKLIHTYPSAPGIKNELYGMLPSIKALTHADIENSLEHFARELGDKYRLVLMGHTHVQEDETEHLFFHKNSLYANSGFCCPSKPDMEQKGKKSVKTRYPSFIETEIDDKTSRFTVRIKAVIKQGGRYKVVPYPGVQEGRI